MKKGKMNHFIYVYVLRNFSVSKEGALSDKQLFLRKTIGY